MADVKISGLPAATTPLAGTEVLPIVQSSTTKKVSIADVTAGRAVTASSVTATNLKTSPATANLDISGTTIAAGGSDANVDVNINAKGTGVAYLNQRWGVNASGALVASSGNTYDIGNGAANPRDVNLDRNLVIKGSSTGTTAVGSLNSSATNYTANLPAANTNIPIASQVLTFSGPSAARTITLPDANFTAARTDAAQSFTGDQTLSTGNLIQGTAAKGFNFTANTPAAGMTSQLFNWYEEGTWTPVLGGSTSESGQSYSTQAGTYVRIGKMVMARFSVVLSAKGTITGSLVIKGLPFASSNLSGIRGGASVGYFSTLAINVVSLFLQSNQNTTALYISYLTGASNTPTDADTTLIGNSSRIDGTVVYETA